MNNANEKLVENMGENNMVEIKEIAEALGLKEETTKLPNGREVKGIKWAPEHLTAVHTLINDVRAQVQKGIQDVIVIDGQCPTFLLPTISHACHPSYTAVSYPQGGPNATAPLSGVQIKENGEGEGLHFTTSENENYTLVEFAIEKPQIDLKATLQTLCAPQVQLGKGICISGRGPIAIAAALAEAYAHKVPYVANFVPGQGYVVSISHDASMPLGTVIKS